MGAILKTQVKSNAENCLINQIEGYLTTLESGKNDVGNEHYRLNKIHSFCEAFAILEPITGFGNFAEILIKLYPSDEYMLDMLNQYQKNLITPDEKVFLAKLQDCALRHKIISGNYDLFQARMEDFQKGTGYRLFLNRLFLI